MMYGFFTNNFKLAELGFKRGDLDHDDIAMLGFITNICLTDNKKIASQRKGAWTWIDYNSMIEGLPFLALKTKSALGDRIQKLENLKLISTKVETKRQKNKKYFRLTKLSFYLLFKKEDVEKMLKFAEYSAFKNLPFGKTNGSVRQNERINILNNSNINYPSDIAEPAAIKNSEKEGSDFSEKRDTGRTCSEAASDSPRKLGKIKLSSVDSKSEQATKTTRRKITDPAELKIFNLYQDAIYHHCKTTTSTLVKGIPYAISLFASDDKIRKEDAPEVLYNAMMSMLKEEYWIKQFKSPEAIFKYCPKNFFSTSFVENHLLNQVEKKDKKNNSKSYGRIHTSKTTDEAMDKEEDEDEDSIERVLERIKRRREKRELQKLEESGM